MTDDHARHYMQQIHNAATQAELDQIALDIDYDRWEEMPWTADEGAINRLRNYWKHRKEQISGT